MLTGAGLAGNESAHPPETVTLEQQRSFLKGFPGDWQPGTPREQGVPEPAREKPVPSDAVQIALPPHGEFETDTSLRTALSERRSRRSFSAEPLSLAELGFLAWSAQGITAGNGDQPPFRTAPSAGGRYPLETYIAAIRVQDIPPGIYRYLPAQHALLTVAVTTNLHDLVEEACYRTGTAGGAAAVFAWTAVPERTEWKYGPLSPRLIAMEAGHVCQNVYLAVEAAGFGACALLSYDQQRMDALLGVDGESEFTLYLCAVGNVAR